jgi:DNA-binding GntR family transcriptional regulator
MLPTSKIISVRDQIADQLRSDIISGDLPPETKLNEQSLAERFGVSRGPIRDVLLQLTKEGLLVNELNKGCSVNTILSPNIQTLMVDIRRKIEEFSIKQLKNKLTEEDFNNLENILFKLGEAFNEENYTEVTKTDIAFHHYLVERAGGNDLIHLWHSIVMRMRMNYKRIGSPKACVDEHREILKALRNNDVKRAAAAVRENIK